MSNPKFIVFEGIDGAGKTTQIHLLLQRMAATSIPFHATKEPTEGKVGSIIRKVLTKQLQLDEKSMAALFLADRFDHIQDPEHGMRQHLNQGKHIICDRYYLSSYAYHSAFLPLDWLIACNAECAKLLRPDVIFFLDLSPEESLARLTKTRTHLDLYETKERLTTVRQQYHLAIQRIQHEENIVMLNATMAEKVIAEKIWAVVEKLTDEYQ
jgi:dTMP kinase